MISLAIMEEVREGLRAPRPTPGCGRRSELVKAHHRLQVLMGPSSEFGETLGMLNKDNRLEGWAPLRRIHSHLHA